MNNVQISKVPTDSLKLHPCLDGFPALPTEEFATLRQSIAEHDILKPLTCLPDAAGGLLVIDGRHRLAAAKELNMPQVPVIVHGAGVDPLAYALESAVTGRNLTKSGIVLILYLKHPELSANSNDRKKANLAKNPNDSRCDKITSTGAVYVSVAETYHVPREYFTRLASIHEACSREEWAEVKTSIMAGDASIPAMYAGVAGRTRTKGKKRQDAQYHVLVPRVASTLAHAFKVWGKIKFDEAAKRKMDDDFLHAFETMPPDVRELNCFAIARWPKHERDALIKTLKSIKG